MSRYQYDPTTEELKLIAGNSYQKFIAPIESSPTKTSHAKGSYLIYGSVLYEVTTAISSGGTIVVYPTSGYNVKVAATLEEQIASVKQALTTQALYFTSVACSATTGNFATKSDSNITADHVVAECTFANPSAITSDVTWTTANGSVTLNGTCASATTANLVLVKKGN
jgi:hypothetical protein